MRNRALACAGLAAWAALAAGGCKRPQGAGEAGSRANFELKDLSGRTVRLSDFQGRVVLLDFWATYCQPCHESIPAFQKLYERYRPEGFEIVGVSVDAFADHVPGFAKEHGMRYPVLLDPDNVAMETFKVHALPTTFLLDRKGAVRREWVGYDRAVVDEIRSGLEGLLRETT